MYIATIDETRVVQSCREMTREERIAWHEEYVARLAGEDGETKPTLIPFDPETMETVDGCAVHLN